MDRSASLTQLEYFNNCLIALNLLLLEEPHYITYQATIGKSMSKAQPIRVLHLIDTLQTGGAERSLLELTSRMDRDKVIPLVCSIYQGCHLVEQFRAAGVEVQQLQMQAKYGLLRGMRKVAQLIKTEKIDLVHTSLFRASQIGRVAGWWTQRPVVSSFTNTPYSAARREWDPAARVWKHFLLHRADQTTSYLPAAFHSVSDSVAQQNCRDLHIAARRVHTVYRGRDTKKFREIPAAEKQQLRETLGVDNGPLLLNIGRLVPQKGQRLAIEMMAQLLEIHPQATLLIAGAGPDEHKLSQLIQREKLDDRVRLLGHRDDIPQLLAIADVFVFPSHYEGLPGAIVEAMLAGAPIVCSKIPMHEEFIVNDDNGTLFSPADVDGMTQAVAALLQNPTRGQQMAAKAKKQATGQFDIDIVVRQMENLLIQTWRSSSSGKQGSG